MHTHTLSSNTFFIFYDKTSITHKMFLCLLKQKLFQKLLHVRKNEYRHKQSNSSYLWLVDWLGFNGDFTQIWQLSYLRDHFLRLSKYTQFDI